MRFLFAGYLEESQFLFEKKRKRVYCRAASESVHGQGSNIKISKLVQFESILK